MKTAVIVILDQFADWEPAFLSSALNNELNAGYRVLFASTDLAPKTSIGGMKTLPDITLAQVPKDAEAVVFIGADGSWRREQPEAESLARNFHQRQKVVAAICDAARWLAGTGLLNGVKHTGNSLDSLQQMPGYTNPGGYLREDAVLDGKIVTANGNAPLAFAASVLRALQAAPEENIQEYVDFYSLGYYQALKKYGYTE